MRLKEVEEDLPILLFYYEKVLRRLERQSTRQVRKVSRTAVLEKFLETHSFVKTGRHFDVSPATINGIVRTALLIARDLARLQPSWNAGDH
jgi:glutamate formiminotransferase